jgi:acetyl esterase/lipase
MPLFKNLSKQFLCSIKSFHLFRRSRFLLITILLFNSINLHPQKNVFEIKIWPNGVPYKYNQHKTETIENRSIEQNEFGLNRSITNVSDPALTVHLPPKEKANGTAVLIFPGGGYNRIVIDKEGHDVARWLNTQGISGIVVKYRTAPEGKNVRGSEIDFEIKNAIQSDAKEAINIVHANVKTWGIDPGKIGVIGFSAGGHLCTSILANFENVSETDTIRNRVKNYRPNFLALIYAAIENNFTNIKDLNFPPTFIVSAIDDKISLPENNIKICNYLLQQSIPAEIHLYTSGGHGFGLGVRGGEVVTWKECFINWLKTNNFY